MQVTGSIDASSTISVKQVEVATGKAVSSSFAQKSAVSSSFVTSSAFTGNMGDISGSAVSTGSFGRLEGSTLQGTIVTPSQTNITSVGTIGTGTWNGTAIATGYIAAALTSQTSMYNAALKIGRDTHNQFDFATDNVINVSVNAVDQEFQFAAGGTFHADADIVAYSSTVASDEKLKINIENTQYGLSDVLKLRGVDFNWKEKLDGRRDVGFIAQEVQKVIPELVREVDGLKGEDSHLAIDYGKVVPILVEAVKEQQGQIDSLKKEVKILKDK